MEFDDSNGKVRRNLLVYSFAIVISTFLNLSLLEHSKVLGAIDMASIPPLRFWIVITFVLMYLFYRYWFDDKTKGAIELFKTEFGSNQYLYIRRLLNNDIENSILKNKKTKYFNNFQELEEPRIVEFNKEYGKPISVVSNTSPTFDDDSKWRGSMTNSYLIEWNGNHYGKNGGNGCNFDIPLPVRYYLEIKILFKMIIYSKSVTELITPISLFYAALIISLKELSTLLI